MCKSEKQIFEKALFLVHVYVYNLVTAFP